MIFILWYLFLFSMCFGESLGSVGNPATYMAFEGVSGYTASQLNRESVASAILGLLFAAYQGMFVVITPALIAGAFADRFRFGPHHILISLWRILVYSPFCHNI